MADSQEALNFLLLSAARDGDPLKLQEALNRGAQPLFADPLGCTALHWSAYTGTEPCVSILLPLSDAHLVDCQGFTPLHCSASTGSTACLSLLLPASNPRARNHMQWTPVMAAAYFGSLDCLELLLPHSDPRCVDSNGFNARLLAKHAGHSDCVQLIDSFLRSQKEHAALGLEISNSARCPTKHSL